MAGAINCHARSGAQCRHTQPPKHCETSSKGSRPLAKTARPCAPHRQFRPAKSTASSPSIMPGGGVASSERQGRCDPVILDANTGVKTELRELAPRRSERKDGCGLRGPCVQGGNHNRRSDSMSSLGDGLRAGVIGRLPAGDEPAISWPNTHPRLPFDFRPRRPSRRPFQAAWKS